MREFWHGTGRGEGFAASVEASDVVVALTATGTTSEPHGNGLNPQLLLLDDLDRGEQLRAYGLRIRGHLDQQVSSLGHVRGELERHDCVQ